MESGNCDNGGLIFVWALSRFFRLFIWPNVLHHPYRASLGLFRLHRFEVAEILFQASVGGILSPTWDDGAFESDTQGIPAGFRVGGNVPNPLCNSRSDRRTLLARPEIFADVVADPAAGH